MKQLVLVSLLVLAAALLARVAWWSLGDLDPVSAARPVSGAGVAPTEGPRPAAAELAERGDAASERAPSQETSSRGNTVLLVRDAATHAPVERFAIRIGASRWERSARVTSAQRDFPGGALQLALDVDGMPCCIQATGYLVWSGELRAEGADSERVVIELDPLAKLTGRVTLAGRPVAGAEVRAGLEPYGDEEGQPVVRVHDLRPTPPGTGMATTDADGRFAVFAAPGWSSVGASYTPPEDKGTHGGWARTRYRARSEGRTVESGAEVDVGELELVEFAAAAAGAPAPLEARPGDWYPLESGDVIEPGDVVEFGDAPHQSGGHAGAVGWHIRPKRAKAAPPTSELPARLALRVRDAHGPVPDVEVRAGGTAVGVTDAAGESLVDGTPGGATTLDFWTAGGLPVGASAPLLALAGESRAETVTLACGGLVLELPEDVTLTPRAALALLLSSPDLPAPGWVALTLRGGGSGATVKGVRWSGRRVEFPHLAPATYDVSLDVLEATSDAPRARLSPTDQRLGARVTVRTGVSETYPLTAR